MFIVHPRTPQTSDAETVIGSSSLLQNADMFINKHGIISQMISVILTKMCFFRLQII